MEGGMNVYLYFNGNCREVFEFYRSVFGGEFMSLQTFADGPPDMDIPDAYMDAIMHVSLPLGNSMLMGSDSAPGSEVVAGNNFSVVVPAESRDQCDTLFAALSKDGEVTMALQETFWGSYFGSCVDRYGINWMFNLDLSGE